MPTCQPKSQQTETDFFLVGCGSFNSVMQLADEERGV